MSTFEPQSPIQVMLIHDDPTRAGWVKKCLRGLGFDTCHLVSNLSQVLQEISAQNPDLLIVDMASPCNKILESLAVVAAHNPIPVVMFSSEESPDYIARAVAAGVSVYLVSAIAPPTIGPMIEVAFAQFRNLQKLRQMLDRANSELSESRTIDKAKLKVMRALKVDENRAYRYLRKEAMNRGLSIAAISNK